jgi:hypothetical protein
MPHGWGRGGSPLLASPAPKGRPILDAGGSWRASHRQGAVLGPAAAKAGRVAAFPDRSAGGRLTHSIRPEATSSGCRGSPPDDGACLLERCSSHQLLACTPEARLPSLSEPMTQEPVTPEGVWAGRPVLVIVDADQHARSTLEAALLRRFGADYQVLVAESAEAGSPRSNGWPNNVSRFQSWLPTSACRAPVGRVPRTGARTSSHREPGSLGAHGAAWHPHLVRRVADRPAGDCPGAERLLDPEGLGESRGVAVPAGAGRPERLEHRPSPPPRGRARRRRALVLHQPTPVHVAATLGVHTQPSSDTYELAIIARDRPGWRRRFMAPLRGCAACSSSASRLVARRARAP